MFTARNQFSVGGHPIDVPQLPGQPPGELVVFHQIQIESNIWVLAVGPDGMASYDFVVVKDGRVLKCGESQWGSSWKALTEGLSWCIESDY